MLDRWTIRNIDGREIYVESVRGPWMRVYRDGHPMRYYWHRIRVPWLLWALFS